MLLLEGLVLFFDGVRLLFAGVDLVVEPADPVEGFEELVLDRGVVGTHVLDLGVFLLQELFKMSDLLFMALWPFTSGPLLELFAHVLSLNEFPSEFFFLELGLIKHG